MSGDIPGAAVPASTLDVLNPARAAAGNPEARKVDQYPAFDWLRFLLASIVLLDHSGVHFPGPLGGGLAVDVFLALSGWLIGGILLKTQRSDLPRFFYNRSTRIWAPYFACVALLYGLALAKQGLSLDWLKYLFYDTTFTHYTFTRFPQALTEMPLGGTGNHFWSISVEEQFYLGAPLLMILLPFGRKIWPWVVVAAVLMALPSRFAPIALGVLAAVIHQRQPLVTGTWPRHLALGLGACITVALMWRWDVMALHAIFAVLVVLALAMPGRRMRLAVFAGAISYPLYLNQWVGGFAVSLLLHHMADPGPGPTVLLTFLASLAVAIASWYVIDRQVMARRNDWYTPARGRTAMIVAYSLLIIGLIGGGTIRVMGG